MTTTDHGGRNVVEFAPASSNDNARFVGVSPLDRAADELTELRRLVVSAHALVFRSLFDEPEIRSALMPTAADLLSEAKQSVDQMGRHLSADIPERCELPWRRLRGDVYAAAALVIDTYYSSNLFGDDQRAHVLPSIEELLERAAKAAKELDDGLGDGIVQTMA